LGLKARDVCAFPAIDDVGAQLAGDLIVARSAVDVTFASAPLDVVVALPAGDGAAALAPDGVGAPPPAMSLSPSHPRSQFGASFPTILSLPKEPDASSITTELSQSTVPARVFL
jgi:hypothetical protein